MLILLWVLVLGLNISAFIVRKYNGIFYNIVKSMAIYSILFGVYFTVGFIFKDSSFTIDPLVVIFSLLILSRLDEFSTRKALSCGAKEANPIAAFLLNKFGEDITFLIMYPFEIILFLWVAIDAQSSIQIACIAMYIAVVVNNSIRYFIRKGKMFRKDKW